MKFLNIGRWFIGMCSSGFEYFISLMLHERHKATVLTDCADKQQQKHHHYCDVIMNTIASQITSLTIVYLTVNSGTDQTKHQSSASLAFVRGIHRRPVNSPHKGPVTRKMFPFDDVIMIACISVKIVESFQWKFIFKFDSVWRLRIDTINIQLGYLFHYSIMMYIILTQVIYYVTLFCHPWHK